MLWFTSCPAFYLLHSLSSTFYRSINLGTVPYQKLPVEGALEVAHRERIDWKSSIEGAAKSPAECARKSSSEGASEVAQRERIRSRPPRVHRSLRRAHTKALVERIRSPRTHNRYPSRPVRAHRRRQDVEEQINRTLFEDTYQTVERHELGNLELPNRAISNRQ